MYTELIAPTYFDHYFRHLYRIMKYIDETELINHTEKYRYAGIVRSTLSRYELIWLFYNCLSEYGRDKFKPLIEKYALMKNFRRELLVKQEHITEYQEGAFDFVEI